MNDETASKPASAATGTAAAPDPAAATPDSAAAARSARLAGTRRRLLLGFGAIVAVLGIGFGAYWLLVSRYYVSTDNAYVAGDVVQVTPQVGGRVLKLMVEDTQRVKAGDLLVELDATDQRTMRARAEAELARAVRDVESSYASSSALAAQVASARAQVESARSELARAEAALARRREVQAEGGVSTEEVGRATQQWRVAQAQLTAARQTVEAAQQQYAANQVQTAGTSLADHPRVLAAAAAVREAIVAEGRARILAPIDGEVAKRSVTIGTQVTPGMPLLAIVPLERVWVEANFKEGQLRAVRAGQPVTLEADLYGGKVEYRGRVAGLSAGTGAAFALLPAQNATGNWIKVVQRVPVRVELDAAQVREHPLRVGLSMSAKIDTHEQDGKPVAEGGAVAAVGGVDAYAGLEAQADERIRQIIEAQKPARAARLARAP